MKTLKILPIIYVLSLIFTFIGATFSFFSAANGSSEGAVESKSTVVEVNLVTSPIYTVDSLIPLDDEDLEKAYENECIDKLGYGACYAYDITLENINAPMTYEGTINFSLNNISNLKYVILDENEDEYSSKTLIQDGVDHSMGNSFSLTENDSKNFKLLIWLSNTKNIDQTANDSNGNFSAIITFRSTADSKIVGSISA